MIMAPSLCHLSPLNLVHIVYLVHWHVCYCGQSQGSCWHESQIVRRQQRCQRPLRSTTKLQFHRDIIPTIVEIGLASTTTTWTWANNRKKNLTTCLRHLLAKNSVCHEGRMHVWILTLLHTSHSCHTSMYYCPKGELVTTCWRCSIPM